MRKVLNDCSDSLSGCIIATCLIYLLIIFGNQALSHVMRLQSKTNAKFPQKSEVITKNSSFFLH